MGTKGQWLLLKSPRATVAFKPSHATVQYQLYSLSEQVYQQLLLHSRVHWSDPVCSYTSLGRVGALVALACISLRSLDSSVSVFANFQAGILRAKSSSSSVNERPLVSGTRKKMSIQTHVAVATNSRTMNGSGAGKARWKRGRTCPTRAESRRGKADWHDVVVGERHALADNDGDA